MEGAVDPAVAGSLVDSPGSVLSPEASLSLSSNGVRPRSAHFARMERRPFERAILDALRLRTGASRPPLDDIILYRMKADFGIEIPRDRSFWPYDPLELSPLLDELAFLDAPQQRISLRQPTDILSHANQLPLLVAELARQRQGMFARLKRMGCGTSELFSSDSMPFFDGGSRGDIREAPAFRIEQVYSTVGADASEHDFGTLVRGIVPNIDSDDQHNCFFFRNHSAPMGVSPGRVANRASKGRNGEALKFRSFIEVYRGGPAYNKGADGC